MEKRDLRAYVVKNSDFQDLVEEFNDFNIEDYKKYNFDDNYIYRVTDGYTEYNTWKPYSLFIFIIDKYEMLTEEEIKTLLEDIDFDDRSTYTDKDVLEEYFFIEEVCKCSLLFEKVNHDLMLELGDFHNQPNTDIELKEYLNKLGIHASDETIEYICEREQLYKIEGLSEAELIDYVIEKEDELSDKEIEYLLKDIDFDESDIYETLSNHDWTIKKVLSIPQIAKKVNHIALWFNLDDDFQFNKDTTLEEYQNYIYDELGLDIEDYLIEERYNCIIEDLKNED